MAYDEVEYRRLIHKYKVNMVGLAGITAEQAEKEQFYTSLSGSKFSRVAVQNGINDAINVVLNSHRRGIDECEDDMIEYDS